MMSSPKDDASITSTSVSNTTTRPLKVVTDTNDDGDDGDDVANSGEQQQQQQQQELMEGSSSDHISTPVWQLPLPLPLLATPSPTTIGLQQSPSYISSASSTTYTTGGGGISPFTPMSSNTMSTIDDMNIHSRIRKNSDDVMNIAPVTPFFHTSNSNIITNNYDSDASDGSFVRASKKSKSSNARSAKPLPPPLPLPPMGSNQIETISTPTTINATTQPQRDRFPSFDSLASNGSVRYVNNSNQASPVRQIAVSSSSQHQQQPQLQPQLQPPTKPLILPYHERKKLQQRRQKIQGGPHQQKRNKTQQQQQIPLQGVPPYHQQQHPHQYPHQQQQQQPHNFGPPMSPQQYAMMMQQQQQPSQNPYAVDPMAVAAYANMYGMPMFPPPPQGYPSFPPPYGTLPQHQQQQQQQQYPGGQKPQRNQPPPYPPPGQSPFPTGGQPPPGVSSPPPVPQGYPLPPYVPQPAGPYPPPHPHQFPFVPPMPSPQATKQAPAASSSQASHPFQPHLTTPQQVHPSQQQHQHQHQQLPSQQRLSPYRTISKQERPPTGKNTSIVQRSSPRPPISGKVTATATASTATLTMPRSPQPLQLPLSITTDASIDSHPPPPPPVSQYHVRTDSIGSLSSLGSHGPVGKDDDEQQRHHRRDSSGGGSGFLHLLRNQWSPQHQDKPKVDISDFHRKNQAFLQKSQPRPHPSPVMNTNHRRVASQERPPASRGTHKRLPSITNDNWEDDSSDKKPLSSASGEASSGGYSSSATDDGRDSSEQADEQTSLLPPSGISTNEREGKDQHYVESSRKMSRRQHQDRLNGKEEMESTTIRWDNRTATALLERAAGKSSRKHRKKKKSRRHKSSRYIADDSSDDSSDSSYDYRQWTQKRARMLEKERSKLIEQWKAEARAEADASQRTRESSQWHKRAGRSLDSQVRGFRMKAFRLFSAIESFIANLPLTIGAVAMAVVTLGVVWFKFAEENLDSCEPVHFHSSQCTFPEFPGCFYCNTTNPLYQLAVSFHYGCSITAGLLAMLFVAKVLLATRVVLDEMSSPTTASPAGLLCMTTVCVFAGRGLIGQVMVTAAACVHLGLVIWFIYMALAYHIMPEPSWFPNTVGVGLTAVKTWLYYPMPGHLLMAISLCLNFFFFPISLIRVAINEKISATVGWMQMSAPAISLYALTIMAQPSFEEEHPDVTRFQRVHRMVYLPCMHVMCALSILGFLASVFSLWTRWHDFKKKEFSPAHAAFCFPTLSHVNAIQAYRGALISFSDLHSHSWRMIILYAYWLIVLVGGTIATIWITAKFLYCLPKWTSFDLDDEEEPPQPYETMMSLQDMVTAGETLRQPFVSPAVLQANETGALVLTRSGSGRLRYVRTRRLLALGFEPTMNWSEMQQEREVLLDYVGKHPPKRRHRTLSVPGVDFSYGSSLGTDNSGVYGAVGLYSPLPTTHRRSDTSY